MARVDFDAIFSDGTFSEQQTLFRRAADFNAKYKEELKNLILLHNCKKGVFCPVKMCKLNFEKTNNDHVLQFELSPQITNLTQSCQMGNSITVNVIGQGYKGYINCSCTFSECMPTLIKTLCNLHLIKHY
ncbi:E3 14.7K [Bat mastadenovirus WIV12]|uniref:E3 14.7K n=1 Tax=Bat mastadenovirus WIV12 TaxID=1788434 RepID=A0A1B0UI19_9ADEN|nr:E3 14.7K [Bat mastadenovirus WIV12]AMB43164.1 E3 14.7K [Bat mastadenovirus WIV12]